MMFNIKNIVVLMSGLTFTAGSMEEEANQTWRQMAKPSKISEREETRKLHDVNYFKTPHVYAFLC